MQISILSPTTYVSFLEGWSSLIQVKVDSLKASTWPLTVTLALERNSCIAKINVGTVVCIIGSLLTYLHIPSLG